MIEWLIDAGLYLCGIWHGWVLCRSWRMWQYRDAADRLIAMCEQGRVGQCSD